MVATIGLVSHATRAARRESAHTPSPDVLVILGQSDFPETVIRIGEVIAKMNGGVIDVVRLVESSRLSMTADPAARSAHARMHLATVVKGYVRAHPDAPVRERLHIGSLSSLLKTLDHTIGMVLVSAAQPEIADLVTSCPVPVLVVDRSGDVTAHLPIVRRAMSA